MTIEHDLPILSYEDAMAFMGSDELFAEIGEMLREELPELMAKIRECFAAGDLHEVSRTAHRVKGNFGVVAAGEAQAAAKLLEYSARDGDAESSAAAFSSLDAAVARVVPVLEQHIARIAG